MSSRRADPAVVTSAKDGRGDFFAVDRRTWHVVSGLGMSPAVAYLVMARGTGGDNRTTKWSTNAVEQRTGIARSRCKAAIEALEKAGVVWRDPASKRDHPHYKLVPVHEIPGCKDYIAILPDEEHGRVLAALGDTWTDVPLRTGGGTSKVFQRWGSLTPYDIVKNLAKLGFAELKAFSQQARAIRRDTEAVAWPSWIWLPNALVDGAGDEVPPVELVRQTHSLLTLRLLVNMYGVQMLDENGGIHFQHIWEGYTRHKVGEQGPFVVWGFTPAGGYLCHDAPFVAPHLAAANDAEKREAALSEFMTCWNRLQNLGLVQFVGHLVTSKSADGEVMYPVALPGTGQPSERAICEAAMQAALMLITEGQDEWAQQQGVVAMAPVERHIENVQMVGVARLLYQPRTARTLAFVARDGEWAEVLEGLQQIEAGQLTSIVQHQGDIKVTSKGIKETLVPVLSRPSPAARGRFTPPANKDTIP